MAWASARCKAQALSRFALPRFAAPRNARHRRGFRPPHYHSPPHSSWLSGGLCSPPPQLSAMPRTASHRHPSPRNSQWPPVMGASLITCCRRTSRAGATKRRVTSHRSHTLRAAPPACSSPLNSQGALLGPTQNSVLLLLTP